MLESVTAEVITTVIIGLGLVVGVVGVILPVIPGSLVVILGLLAWGILISGSAVWTAAGIGLILTVLGWSASAVLTGRVLYREHIPRGPVLLAFLAGVVGLVFLPPVGLFIGFAAGLFGAEYLRRDHDWRAAGASSLRALRAMGIGIIIEFLCAGTAVSLFVIGTFVHFIS